MEVGEGNKQLEQAEDPELKFAAADLNSTCAKAHGVGNAQLARSGPGDIPQIWAISDWH